MEILQFLLSFLSNNQNREVLNNLVSLFQNGSFDLNKILSSITPEMLEPLIKSFMNNEKSPHPNDFGRGVGLEPIINIADKDIVYSLNKIMVD